MEFQTLEQPQVMCMQLGKFKVDGLQFIPLIMELKIGI